MRVLRVLVVVSLSSVTALATAQSPAAKPAAAPSATAKPAATTSPAAGNEDGNPAPNSPFPAGPPSKGGQELDAIHKTDIAWRGRSGAIRLLAGG
jgi:hypothetical protein